MFADFSLEIMVLKWHRNFLGAKKITYSVELETFYVL